MKTSNIFHRPSSAGQPEAKEKSVLVNPFSRFTKTNALWVQARSSECPVSDGVCPKIRVPFLFWKIIESQVGTSVVQFLVFENVGVIFEHNIFCWLFILSSLFSWHLLLHSCMLGEHWCNRQESKTKTQRKRETTKENRGKIEPKKERQKDRKTETNGKQKKEGKQERQQKKTKTEKKRVKKGNSTKN